MKKNILLLCFVISFHAFVSGQIATIPFQLLDNSLVFIKIGVNNCDSLKFYFDTGAATTLIDETSAQRIGLKPDYEQQIQGAGGNRTYKMALSQSVVIDNDIRLDSINMVIDDLSRLKSTLGQNFDGIIGYDILKNYITNINFDTHTLKLYAFGSKTADSNEYIQHFNFKNGIPIPQFPVTITLQNGKCYSDTVLFDSGAALSLLINTPYKEQNDLLNQLGKTIETQNNNLSKTSTQIETLISSIQIGKFKLGENVIGLASDTIGVSAMKDYLGILGNKVIHQFNFTTDYSEMKLYLQPNQYYNSKPDYPVSGIKLKLVDGKVLVANIVKSSTAFLSGLRENDEILSINGIKSTDLSTYRQILSKENTKVSISFQTQDTAPKTIRIKLKRLL